MVQVARGIKVVKVIFKKKHVSNFRLSDLFSYLFIACKAFQKRFMTFKTFMYLLAHFYFRQVIQLWNPSGPGFGFNWNCFEKSQSWEEAGKHLIQTRFILKFNFS